MPHQVPQSSTQGFYIFADNADAYGEGMSGLSISVSLSKGGGAFNAVSPIVTDLGGGVYWVAPLAAHRDTLGEIAWRFAADGAVVAPRFERVVAVNDQVAHWGVPAAVLSAAVDNPIASNVKLFLDAIPEYIDPNEIGTGDALLDKQIEILNAIITLKNSGLNFSIDIPDTATVLRNTQRVFTKEIARAAIFTANQSIEDITLSLIFELSDSTDIVVVADEDLAKEDDTVSVTLPLAVVDTARSVVWCIRNSIDGTVYGQGTFKVTYAPSADNG